MTTLSPKNLADLANWIIANQNTNWGGWGNYPSLPVGASYLQYDDEKSMQINFSAPVVIDGEEYNCIVAGRPVGRKWNKCISTSEIISIGNPEWYAADQAAMHATWAAEREAKENGIESLPIEVLNAYREIAATITSTRGRKKAIGQSFIAEALRERGLNITDLIHYC